MASEKFEQFLSEVEALKDDVVKFYEKENKAAGARLRKGLQNIKNLAKELRAEISELKKKSQD